MSSQELVKHYSARRQRNIDAKTKFENALDKLAAKAKLEAKLIAVTALSDLEAEQTQLKLNASINLSDAQLETVVESYGLPRAINHALSALASPVGAFV